MSETFGSAAPAVFLREVEQALATMVPVADYPAQTEDHARQAYEAERSRIVTEQLERMPLESLKAATEGRLRLGMVESAGFRTVAAVRDAGRYRLEAIDGVGPVTAAQALGAAEQVASTLEKATRVRFDVDARPAGQTALLTSLRVFGIARRNVEPLQPQLDSLRNAIEANLEGSRLEAHRVKRFFSGTQKKQTSQAAYHRLAQAMSEPGVEPLLREVDKVQERMAAEIGQSVNIWDDYIANSVIYNGLLIGVGGLAPDDDASQGFIPDEIVERIRAFELDTTLLGASLRGYQSFGAKFALVQKRTILGDEMGLGKTIEALAMFCHLRSHGATHFLVVSPASVLANWEHEIGRHSRLERTWRLHGPERDRLLKLWVRDGGVAITTFDTLRALDRPDIAISAMVIDEAHYVKNPQTKRTRSVKTWLQGAEHALLMSGTPMENRVEEFRALVDHVRPDLAQEICTTDGLAGADAFRKAVAPVYLRRNQSDVLNELPPRIDTPEWLTLEGPSARAYVSAVADGNFMAMRRSAFLTEDPLDSPKLQRLLEIAEEAADNGRKVVVFSYFRDVIDRVHAALGPLAAGPLTGSVSPADRQLIVDRFSAHDGPLVLVSQIEAGGVGLNIQAASVVVLAEPQWKPSTEDQAIARCHRMGQVRPVEVHRLLAEDSVDDRMLEILARKSSLFAEYVRASAMKEATPEAVDVTDDTSTNQVASQAEQERRIIELERRRLGLDQQPLLAPKNFSSAEESLEC